ncbi:MAG: hypothetical protein GF346_11635 [Candidatus Eisenbacteria bacterium]|nr:hypothetical protein [Candidatus Latescibacterota bacterium]MBD3303088.1 hypothetical protein [Candidatus Eisenbacteria bacterium]
MPTPRRSRNPAVLQGVLLLLVAAFVGLALATHGAEQPASGPWADRVAGTLLDRLGPILTWTLWALLLPTALLWLIGRPKRGILRRGGPIVALAVVATIGFGRLDSLGSRFGRFALDELRALLGPYGAWIVLAGLAFAGAWLAWRVSLPARIREGIAGAVSGLRLPSRPPRPRTGERDRPLETEKPKRPLRLKLVGEGKEEVVEAPSDPPPVDPGAPVEPTIRERSPIRSGGARPIRPAPEGKRALPEIDLLEEVPGTRAAIDREEILETSRQLMRTLQDFGIRGSVGEVHPGPVVTRYEYEPAPGVRVSQIVSRVDDITLALRAESIRLVAPIPGKAAIGIEVPNRNRAMISLKEILETDEFRALRGPLPLALGREISGAPVFADLASMPHLLVAGTTGSGKSVCLNCLLLSLLFRNRPEDLRLILIDPKRLELTPYDGIPALVCPVITEARQAVRMLEWLCLEMERRYKLLQNAGVKGIEGYRKKAAGEEEIEPLPYIVVVVDELADLMTSHRAEMEGPVSRLAHMARAVGIHMIFATQRPSVDVLTGVVKANFPSRIAFRVASRIDSRTILDAGGAECLLGRGDMLFLPPGKAEAFRVHGAFCSEGDAARVAAVLREQPAAPSLIVEEEEEAGPGAAAAQDDLFEEALRVVVRERQASASFLQRRLSVGYARAARLMDLLEAAGVVSPYDGSKAREVMVDESDLEEFRERSGSQG